MPRTSWTISACLSFFDKYGFMPFPLAGGEGEHEPKPVTFKDQASLDAVIEGEKAKAKRQAQEDPEFLKTVEAAARAKVSAELDAANKLAEGKNGELLQDVLSVKDGAIPDDSNLGKVIKTLYGRNKAFEETFKTVIDADLQKLPEAVRDLMPEGLDPDKQIAWIQKALKVQAASPTGPTGPSGASGPTGTTGPTGARRPGNSHRDPKPGDSEVTVDEIAKEMEGLGLYRRR